MKKILMLTAAALILQIAPVLAESHGDSHDGKKERGAKMFAEHDTNGDGVISEAEFMADAKTKFSKIDTNGDGSLSKEEMKANHEARREKMREMKEKWKEGRGEKHGDDRPDADAGTED